MRINHNIAALNTYRQLSSNNVNTSKSLEKLSSGLRINRAGDDAAGLAISEKMRAQIRGLDQASRNSQDAISLIQTGEGALNETQSILQRMRELAVQASNDTNVSVDRSQIQKEMNQLSSEVNRICNTTEFNTMKLLNGDRSITVASQTSEVVLKSGAISITFAAGVTGNASMTEAVGSFTVASGANTFMDGADTDCSALLTITRNGTDIDVTIRSTGVSTLTAADTIHADANGDYTYNDHGISFTITAANFANITAGASMQYNTAGVAATAGTKGAVSNYNLVTATAGVSAALTAITVSKDTDTKDVRSMVVVATTAQVTVTLLDSAGTTIQEDVMSGSATFQYNDHGISFGITGLATLTTGNTLSATFTFTASGSIGTETDILSTTYTDNSVKFQVGANQNQAMTLDVNDMRGKALNITSDTAGTVALTSGTTAYFVSTMNVTDGTSSTNSEYSLDVSDNTKAAAAITVLNDAITNVSEERAKLGSVQNRLEHTINNLSTSSENLTASESRIRDVDMAKEMMEFAKNNILTQAAQSMLAQANQQPQGVLQLLR